MENKMKIHGNIFTLFFAIILVAMIYLPVPQKVYALTNDCTDMNGMMIPCPDTGGGGSDKPGPKNHPTAIITRPTSTSTSTPPSTSTSTPTSTQTSTPTSTQAAIPITGGGVGLNNTNSSLPAVQNPGQGTSPLPGPLGIIIAVLIIAVCFIGGLGVLRFFRKAGETNASFADGSVRNGDTGNQFEKISNTSSQFDKSSDGYNQLDKLE
jgi:hypothetical protein